MTSRPVVSVYETGATDVKVKNCVPMPGVFSVPIRNDLVHFVHSNLAKNRRQGHAVYWLAGQEHSAESWGTGRAVARIPRISGSGTHRSGQATFGNMCRSARMFAPLKIWRKWHAKANVTQRRHAVASALAASACAPLVMARGHRVDGVPELPLVLDQLNSENTKGLLTTLNRFGCGDDLAKVRRSKQIRQGTGKYRNSRYVMRKGPLVIYGDKSENLRKAARNLPGVDCCHVSRLNVLQLAPGGHLGRFCVFTEDAFRALNNQFGTNKAECTERTGYHLNRHVMNCADLSRIINSDQVQAKLRGQLTSIRVHHKTKKNPLKNKAMMLRLNPFAKKRAELVAKREADRHKGRAAALKAKRSKAGRAAKHTRNERSQALQTGLVQSFADADAIIAEEIRQGAYQPGDSDDEEEDN
jgi:large subunit ribosomal protein L4e